MRRTAASLALTMVVAFGTALLPADEGIVPSALGSGVAHAADDSATTMYVPVTPCRLGDTRLDTGFVGLDGGVARLRLDTCGIPDDATAIIANATIIQSPTTGWLVGYPTGGDQPTAATLNWGPWITRGNTATITIGDDRSIDLYKSDGWGNGFVTLDVVGAFVPADRSRAGRLETPDIAERLLDTRLPGETRPDDDTTINIPLPDQVPDDASALAITITAVGTDRRAFYTAYPAGEELPVASALNSDDAGQIRAAATVVPVNEDGFDVYVDGAAHIVVDMTGWFTGPSAERSSDGLFVPATPQRLRDTRPELYPLFTDGTIEIEIPDDVTGTIQAGPPRAVAVSMTMIGADDTGYITAHPARVPRGATASGHGKHNELTAQFGIVTASTQGLAVYSEQGTDLTMDLLGWFTGTAVEPVENEPAPNPIRRQRVLAVGDSTMAAVRWYGAFGSLQGADWTFEGESCRRLLRTSCRGREGRRPPTAVQELQRVGPGYFDVIVIMTGYNDVADGFAAAVDATIDAARRTGARRIIWLTQTREFRWDIGGADAFQVYAEHNAAIRAAGDANYDVVVVEWANKLREAPSWFHDDGIHFTKTGSFGNGDFMSRAVAHVTGQRCPQPYVAGGASTGICADPGTQPPINVRSLYDFDDNTVQCWEVGPNRRIECVPDPIA